jgi:asparagine synthase (glutamine-hydrolysing)
MCGIAGLWTSAGHPRDVLADHAGRMAAPLAHRGPDDGGVWVDERAGVGLAFRRLAILDLSPLGHQPMASASGRFEVVFNGEIYNFGDLREQLQARGHHFRGTSDTEVLLAALEEWGVGGAVPRFSGMFAVACWDADRRELSLVRDRLGKKPLYVHRGPGLVTFGSELKALVAGPSFDHSIDRAALGSYLRYLYVPAPRSIFAGAVKVPAGHVLTLSDPAAPLPAARPYWSLHDVARRGLADPIVSDADAVDALDALLVDAVKSRLRADVPLGALLSGGVDSSTVVALMQEADARPVKTYTIGFADGEYDEARHAARVARHLGTDHTELQLTGEDALRLVPRLPDIFDEPLADPSQVPTCLVAQLARRHVTVALCGDGGDELFGGYNRYVYGTRVLPRVERLPRGLRRRVGEGMSAVSCATWDRVGRAAALVPGVPRQRVGERVHKLAGVMAAGSVADMYRSLWPAWRPEETLLEAPPAEDVNLPILDAAEPAGLLDRMLLADQAAYLPDDQLARVDRASMAASLELRSPLLDHRVVELSWRIPAGMKLRGATGKWVLRQVLHRRVPRALVERPKMGFSIPVDRWLRGPLRSWAAGLLDEQALRRDGLLDPRPIRAAWDDLQEGRRPTGMALWAIVMFQAWRGRWGAAPSATTAASPASRACA